MKHVPNCYLLLNNFSGSEELRQENTKSCLILLCARISSSSPFTSLEVVLRYFFFFQLVVKKIAQSFMRLVYFQPHEQRKKIIRDFAKRASIKIKIEEREKVFFSQRLPPSDATTRCRKSQRDKFFDCNKSKNEQHFVETHLKQSNANVAFCIVLTSHRPILEFQNVLMSRSFFLFNTHRCLLAFWVF